MHGLTLDGVRDVRWHAELPEPRLLDPRDAIVAVSAAGLCGSDLHPYRGHEPARAGVVPGHELVGEVLAHGEEVAGLRPGDRVLAAFATSCGRCPPCRRGLTARCRRGQLFGWGPPEPDAGAALDGAQAQRVRVPLADTTLISVPDGVDDATAVLLTDNLPTAVEAVRRTDVAPGEPLVVVGLGSVGLCAVAAARHLGAEPVLAVDPVADRRERASRIGAAATSDPVDAPVVLAELLADHAVAGSTADATDEVEHQAPAVIDAAGSTDGQRLAFELTRPGGTLSIIAVQTSDRFAFTPVEAYDRNLTVRAGRASVRTTLDTLLPEVAARRFTVPSDAVVTHPAVPLAEGPELYRRFDAHEHGLVKALLRP